MQDKTFKLCARVSTSNPDAVEAALRSAVGRGTVSRQKDEFIVVAEMEGVTSKELNRTLLSRLRRVEKKTRLRSEWTCGGITERYFDYVLKKTLKTG